MYMYPLLRETLFKMVFELIAMENVEILVCAGDLNMTLNHKLGTTNNKRCKSQLSRLVNISLTELGMFQWGVE